jgi:hypothetical protein
MKWVRGWPEVGPIGANVEIYYTLLYVGPLLYLLCGREYFLTI